MERARYEETVPAFSWCQLFLVCVGVGCASAKDGLAQDGVSVEVDLPRPPPSCEPLAHGGALPERISNALGGLGHSCLSPKERNGWGKGGR